MIGAGWSGHPDDIRRLGIDQLARCGRGVGARAHEGEVTRLCAQAAPKQVTDPLAVDPTTGRMLLSDGGTTLYSADHEHRGLELDSVLSVVCDYGRLQ